MSIGYGWILLVEIVFLMLPSHAFTQGDVLDRVVAVVNGEIITSSQRAMICVFQDGSIRYTGYLSASASNSVSGAPTGSGKCRRPLIAIRTYSRRIGAL